MPGSIGATPIEAPIDVEEGLPVEVPIVYFYGHTTPSEHPELYMFLVDRLASLLDKRSRTSPQVTPIACRILIQSVSTWTDALALRCQHKGTLHLFGSHDSCVITFKCLVCPAATVTVSHATC